MNKKFDIDGQFYVTYGWMRSRLGLKGSMLELYALVYGYHASGREFTASLNYMCEWTGLSESNVVANLKKLVKNDFLIHNYVFINGHKVGKYEINKKKLMTIEIGDIAPKIGETTPKINDNNIVNNNNITLNIEEREWKFRDELRKYESRYGMEIIEAFYRYWSEPTQDRSKMKYELQETWDVGRRLENWNKRENKNKPNYYKGGDTTEKTVINNGYNYKQNFNKHETENERRIREEREAIVAELGGACEW